MAAPRTTTVLRAKEESTSTSSSTSTTGQAWQEGFVLSNPLATSDVTVLDTNGNSIPIRSLASGKTVVGLLRHLGCAMCWEQATNLYRLMPQLEALGFKLKIVAIGFPEGGKELCAKLPFPEELLFLDPEMKVYTELHLNAGLKYFMNKETWNGIRGLDQDLMKDALKRYSFIKPPNVNCTLQMGGLYVVDGDRLLFGHMDKGLGAHAANSDVLAACATA